MHQRSTENFHLQKNITLGIKGTQLCFSLPVDASEGIISVYEADGQRVAHIELAQLNSGIHQVSLPKFSPGFYTMSITIDKLSTTRKLVATGSALYLNGAASDIPLHNKLAGVVLV